MKFQLGTRSKKVVTIAAFMCLGLAGVARADLTGSTIDGSYYFPDAGTLYVDIGQLAAPGAVFDLNTNGIIGIGTNTVTVNGDQILISLNPGLADDFTGASFNGIVLTDISGDPGISGVTVDSTGNFGLTDGDLGFTSNSISINFQGLSFGDDNGDVSTAVLDISFASAPAPEPASLALLGAGLAGLAAVRRRRRT